MNNNPKNIYESKSYLSLRTQDKFINRIHSRISKLIQAKVN
jgi:hypothetical protein